MKSRELIRWLQEEDPSGETEVSVGNHDIYSLHTEPAYWDGRLQLLTRDDSKKPYYDVVGAKYTASGSKIVITAMGVADAIWNDADLPVDYSEAGNEETANRYRENDDKTRAQVRDVELRGDMDSFYGWVKKKMATINPGEDCRSEADEFYEHNLSPNDPVKTLPAKKGKDGFMWHPSWNDRREAAWEDTIEVLWSGYVDIRKK